MDLAFFGERELSKKTAWFHDVLIWTMLAMGVGFAGGCGESGDADENGDASVSDGDVDGDTGDTSDTGEVERGPWIPETVDPNEMAASVPTVEITISPEARAALEAAPFYGEDVPGTFIDGDGNRYEDVDINFRGAYRLSGLIDNDPIGRRNWKVKFPKDQMYRGRREWNLNFEPHLRQKLAYDLMKFAGVKVPNATQVVLKVNGEAQGLYLQYEDPDSKDWLWDAFGDEDGDLYKAAFDMPPSEGHPDMKYFALTTYLGEDDGAYPYHYNKKTNHKDPAIADDFSALKTFLYELNNTPDEELQAWFEANLDVERFLRYLVVSNFISNWDSFPQRPKNFWLFENRRESRMAFIPWDLDLTFQTWTDDYNQMGPETPVMYSLKTFEYEPIHAEEGTLRPLATRLFGIPSYEQAYRDRYVELCDTILSQSYLDDRLDRLAALVSPHLTDALTSEGWGDRDPTTERSDFEDSLENIREFIAARAASVRGQLGL